MAVAILACTAAVSAAGPANAAGPVNAAGLANTAGPAGAAGESPEVIAIDLLLAGDYTDAARKAIQIWNEAVPTIKFVEQGTVAPLRVKACTTANGTSSHVYINGAGRGWVYLENGDKLVYKPTRVVAHELGHILSLNDIGGTDPSCSKLMSGAQGGTGCQNDHPDPVEIAEVGAFFDQNDVGDPVPWFHG